MIDNGAINRVLRLVSLLSDHPHLTSKQAAALLGWPVSTTHRLLRKLLESEFASQTNKGNFAAGMELYRIAGRLGHKVPFVRIAEPLLVGLSDKFRETSMLTILERRQQRMYIAASAAPADPMRYIIELNKTSPLIWGAAGRSLLAFMDDEEVQKAIDSCETPDVRGKALDAGQLRTHLRQIAQDGYAVTHSHRTLNSVGVAVPFFDGSGAAVGSIVFQIPEFRFSEAALPELVAALKDTATVISQQIGAREIP